MVLYAKGRKDLRNDPKLTAQQLDSLPEFVLNGEIDRELVKRLARILLALPSSGPITPSPSRPALLISRRTDRSSLRSVARG